MGKELRESIVTIAIITLGSVAVVKILPPPATDDSLVELSIIPATEDKLSTPLLPATATRAEQPQIHLYYALTLDSTSTSPIKQLEEAVGKDNVNSALKLNRIDGKFLKRRSVLTIPQDLSALNDFLVLSPFPKQLSLAQAVPKLLVVSRRVQAFGVYELGTLVRWGPVSSGKESSPTPTGLYSVNWKMDERHSSFNDSWILPWAINLDNHLGIDLHQYDLPGYPASHSCMRTDEADAMWLNDWVDTWIISADGGTFRAHGTAVIVFGDFDYDAKSPWKELPDNPNATTISTQELETVLGEYIETIQIRFEGRERITGVN